MAKRYPVTRAKWATYYARQFNRTGHEAAATLAVWYLLLNEAFGE